MASADKFEKLIDTQGELNNHIGVAIAAYVRYLDAKAAAGSDATKDDLEVMRKDRKDAREAAKKAVKAMETITSELNKHVMPASNSWFSLLTADDSDDDDCGDKKKACGYSRRKTSYDPSLKRGPCYTSNLTSRGREACLEGRQFLNKRTGRWVGIGRQTHKKLCDKGKAPYCSAFDD